MPRLRLRLLGVLSAIAVALAVVASALALGLGGRRRDLLAVADPAPEAAPVKAAPAPEQGESTQEDAPPPLSPVKFAVTHFGLLVVLLAIMVGGLALRGIRRYPPQNQFHVNGGDPARGRQAIATHGCGGCHVIPGVRGADGRVGPSLKDFGNQMYIAGQLPNTPDYLIPWLQNPQRYAPGTAMPNLPVTEAEARDVAAFLYAVD